MTVVLEALLLTAVTGQATPLTEARRPAAPSLELLEFLGEFGDDEEGLFDGGAAPPAPPKDAKTVKAPPRPDPPPTPAPASPPTLPKERT